MTDFDTGDVGENWVQLWASQAGITANPVRRDKKGWDFCLQFRRDDPVAARAPLDRLAPELTCMVQVKTTLRGADSESVKLSNWERMVKDPFPWFFLRVELNEEGDATAAFLIHVGDTWIEKALRRLREAGADEADALHKHDLTLTWRDETPLAKPFGTAMRDRIRSIVGDLDAYVKRKALFRSTVGYKADAHQTVTITTALTRSKEDIERGVDFALGLEEQLPISALVVKDLRFNMPSVVSEKRDLTDGYMQFASSVPSIGTTTLIFSDQRRTRSVSLACETYVPTLLFPNLPKEHFKVRMAHPLVSIVTVPPTLKMNLSWRIPDDDPVALADLVAAGDLLLLLAVATPENGVTVAYERDGDRAEIGYADAPVETPAAVRELATVAQHASFLAHYFGLPATTLVQPAQIHRQLLQLICLRAVVDRTMGKLDIAVGMPGDASIAGKRTAIVVPMSARIGDYVLAASVVYAGSAKWDDVQKRLSVENGEAKLLAKGLVPVNEWSTYAHRSRARQLADELSTGSEYEHVAGPDDSEDAE